MMVQEGAKSVWFGRGMQNDAQFLHQWRSAPLTYSAGQDLDGNWFVDRYETILGNDPSGALFERAAQLTLTNQFYPPQVMTTVSDFNLVGRSVQAGDRIVQRIPVFRCRDLPIFDVLTMNEITQVINDPRRAGFTYTTTSAHSEIGEWSPTVEWRDNNEVALIIDVVSRSRPGTSTFSRRLIRRMQLRAHQMSIQNFLAKLHGVPAQFESEPRPTPVASLLSMALLGGTLALVVSLIIGRRKK